MLLTYFEDMDYACIDDIVRDVELFHPYNNVEQPALLLHRAKAWNLYFECRLDTNRTVEETKNFMVMLFKVFKMENQYPDSVLNGQWVDEWLNAGFDTRIGVKGIPWSDLREDGDFLLRLYKSSWLEVMTNLDVLHRNMSEIGNEFGGPTEYPEVYDAYLK